MDPHQQRSPSRNLQAAALRGSSSGGSGSCGDNVGGRSMQGAMHGASSGLGLGAAAPRLAGGYSRSPLQSISPNRWQPLGRTPFLVHPSVSSNAARQRAAAAAVAAAKARERARERARLEREAMEREAAQQAAEELEREAMEREAAQQAAKELAQLQALAETRADRQLKRLRINNKREQRAKQPADGKGKGHRIRNSPPRGTTLANLPLPSLPSSAESTPPPSPPPEVEDAFQPSGSDNIWADLVQPSPYQCFQQHEVYTATHGDLQYIGLTHTTITEDILGPLQNGSNWEPGQELGPAACWVLAQQFGLPPKYLEDHVGFTNLEINCQAVCNEVGSHVKVVLAYCLVCLSLASHLLTCHVCRL